MNAGEILLHLAARCTAPSRRDIRLEEWLGDLRSCGDLGIKPQFVVFAALRYVLTVMNLRNFLSECNPNERSSAMNRTSRTIIRLAFTATWSVASISLIYIFLVHLNTAGNNLGFTLPGGQAIPLTPLFITIGVISLFASISYFAFTLRRRALTAALQP